MTEGPREGDSGDDGSHEELSACFVRLWRLQNSNFDYYVWRSNRYSQTRTCTSFSGQQVVGCRSACLEPDNSGSITHRKRRSDLHIDRDACSLSEGHPASLAGKVAIGMELKSFTKQRGKGERAPLLFENHQT